MTDSPSTTTIKVGTKDEKLSFEFPNKYTEGHALTDVEARALNRVRAENIANNCRKVIQATIEQAEGAMSEADLRTFVENKAAEYEFSLASAGGGRSSLNPVEKEARRMARAALMAKLKEAGKKYSDYNDEQKAVFADAVVKYSETDNFVKAAKKRVAEAAKAVEGILDDLDI